MEHKIHAIYAIGIGISIIAIAVNIAFGIHSADGAKDLFLCLADPMRSCFRSNIVIFFACLLFACMMAQMCRKNDAKKRVYELDMSQVEKDRAVLRKIKKELEERIVQQESIWKHSKDYLVLFSIDGRILRASNSAYEIIGVPDDKKETFSMFDLLDEPQIAIAKDRLERMAHGEDVGEIIYWLRKWGREKCDFPVEISTTGSVLNGEPCALAIARPIEDRIRLQEEQAKNERIEAISTLSAGIAHDFNNLLCAIGGNAQLLELNLSVLCEKNTDEKCINYLRQITNAVGSATNLTRQLSMLAKGSSQERKIIDLTDTLRNVGEISVGHGSRCRLKMIIPNDLKPVHAIEGQIDQVVQNMLINARHAMPDGGVIELGARNVFLDEDNRYNLASGYYVEVWVKDNGTGIDEDHLPRIFDPYFSTKENGKGTGLGLTSAYRAIENHGGGIIVRSRPGKGTRFVFCLPAETSGFESFSNRPDAVRKMPQKIMKVLVMDDELALREVMNKMLLRFGHRVFVASDGEEALALYQEHQRNKEPFDLVILDQTIPGGMGGMQTIHALKKIDPNVRSIGYSGYTDDVPEGIYDAFLAKPIQMNDLEKALQKIGRML